MDVLIEMLESVPLAAARSIRRNGFWSTLRLCLENVGLLFGRRRREIRTDPSVREFDTEFGVATAGHVPLQKLGLPEPREGDEVDYQPSPPTVVRNMLRALRVDLRGYTFVDVGCGKGIASLVASEFPFRKIIGVDLSPSLCEIARGNVVAFRSPKRKCNDIEIICADAARLHLPETPSVLYFFQPFGRATLRQVLANLQASLEAAPRDLAILFYWPKVSHRRLIERSGLFERVHSEMEFCVYHHRNRQLRASAQAAASGNVKPELTSEPRTFESSSQGSPCEPRETVPAVKA